MRPDAGKDRIQKPGSGRNSLPAAEKERNNNTGGGGRRRRREKPPEIPPAKALSPWFEKCRLDVQNSFRDGRHAPDNRVVEGYTDSGIGARS